MDKELNLKEEVKKLPFNPGVYIMKNSDDKIIYIGKAKNLKNRVSSYFVDSSGHSDKVKELVKNISHFEYIITDSEFEALVLECSLIKKHQPKYNILLKDDKGYSYIKITNERWPRILDVKQKLNDGALYIGPYINSLSVKNVVEEITKIFKIPVCNRDFSKFYKRPCLNYYINRCSAPCIKAVTHEKYSEVIEEVIKFIKNGSTEIIKYLTEKMQNASENLEFEYAAEIRDKIKAIEKIKSRQKVVSYKVKNFDVIALAHDNSVISFEVFRFNNGDLYESQNFIIDYTDDLPNVRAEFLNQYYTLKSNIPKNIFIDGETESLELLEKFLSEKSNHKVKISIPKIGDGLKLLNMCQNNAHEFMIRSKQNKNRYEDILEDLKNVLNLKNVPKYIEAYDISNINGSNNVGGMVVFKGGRPFKSGYRKFKIKNIVGQDDYNSMKEMLERRFDNYWENNKLKSSNDTGDKAQKGFDNLPDLLLIDGGKTHVSAAKDVLKSKKITIPVFGMVKDNKHRTRAITTDNKEIEIKNNSRIFYFITSVQDEVHRFTINYHKNLRNKSVKSSELIKIPGIGESRAKKLLNFFKSIKRISQASTEELMLIDNMNESAATAVYNYFRKN